MQTFETDAEFAGRKERIFAYMTSKAYIPLKHKELMTVLDVPEEAEEEFDRVLTSLTEEGKIYISKKGRYMAASGSENTASGVLHCNAGGFFGFVAQSGGGEIYIPGKSMNTAIDGDTVLVGIDSEAKAGRFENANAEGHIMRVLKRAHETIIGTVYEKKPGKTVVKPDNLRIYSCVEIEAEEELIGKRVCVRITEYTKKGMRGEIEEILGEADSLKGFIDGIVLENGIKSEFDAETLAEAENVPLKISGKDTEGRLDLRDKLIFTIDGETAKDFDDAVSLEMTENGNYRLGVHIADVTHYVKQGTALDGEAFSRSTSVYLADRVIPMLPERLSNGICSLNPNEDRLTLTVFEDIDSGGNVISYSLHESIIQSKYRLTYEDINAVFAGDEELSKKYADILPTLKSMSELAGILNKKREKRGAIQFDFPETQIIVNEKSEPVDIAYYVRGVSNKMIEEFMLAANEAVAEFAFWAELPFVYRAHEAPSAEKITAFNEFLKNFSLRIKGSFDDDNPIHPKALQQILDAVKDTPEEKTVADTMLRSLMKADYRPECIGHFGLAAKYYCHFTSPIRRYPDLAIHRILKEYLKHGTEELQSFRNFVSAASVRSSEAEITAETAEREVDSLMKAKYMADFVGASYDAVISGITSFGIFVTLENSAEGLIRLQNMTDDYYELDETSRTITGKRGGLVYKIGDMVRVTLVNVNLTLRRIDFVFEKDAGPEIFKRFNEDKPKQSRERKKTKHKKKKKRKKNK